MRADQFFVYRHAMPPRLRCLLYRALHFQSDSRHARGQARRHALRTVVRGQPLSYFWPPGTARMLRRTAAVRGHVRQRPGRCHALAGRAGAVDCAASGAQTHVTKRPYLTAMMRCSSKASLPCRTACHATSAEWICAATACTTHGHGPAAQSPVVAARQRRRR